jgi:hypothetical protein
LAIHLFALHQQMATKAPAFGSGWALGRVINRMLMIEQGFRVQTSQTIEAAK